MSSARLDYLLQLSTSFLLQRLVSSLGLLALSCLRGGGLDDAHSHGLPHIAHSKPAQGWEQ